MLRRFLPPKRPHGFVHYVALGDSISTDDYPGKGRGAASLLYQNANDSYEDFHGKDLKSTYPGIKFHSLARDGATTIEVLQEQLPHLPRPSSAKVLFTLTAGGNDLLALQDSAQVICQRLNTVVFTLRESFPAGMILLCTVYDPTDGTGELYETGVKRKREMEILRQLNASICKMNDDPHVIVIDIHRHFLGHGYAGRNSEKDPSLWYTKTIEPNRRGAHEIRRLWWSALTSSKRE